MWTGTHAHRRRGSKSCQEADENLWGRSEVNRTVESNLSPILNLQELMTTTPFRSFLPSRGSVAKNEKVEL